MNIYSIFSHPTSDKLASRFLHQLIVTWHPAGSDRLTERAAAAAAFRICQKEAIGGGGVDSEAAATDARYHLSGMQLIIWQPWPILK